MGIRRYELSEAQWARIALLLPGKSSDPGRTGSDNRLFVNGCLWVLRSGAHWCDLPERYGRWKTVHRGPVSRIGKSVILHMQFPSSWLVDWRSIG